MNKKYLVYSILIASFASSISFPMHSLLFRGVQLISGGYCIGKGFEKAYKREQGMKKLQSFSDRRLMIHEDEPIHEFVAHETKRLNVAKPTLYDDDYNGWMMSRHGIYVPYHFRQHLRLKKILERKQNERKNLTSFESHSSDIVHYLDDEIQEYQKKIDAYEATKSNRFHLYHELGHQINDDCNWRTYAEALSPIAVQAVGSSITYASNKLCDIKSPRTILQLLGRSSLAVGAIPLKIALAYCGTSFYCRYAEWRADAYACKNADEKDLEVASNYYQNHYIKLNKDILEDPYPVLLDGAKGIFKNNKIIVEMISKRLCNGNIRADEDSLLLRVAHFIYDPEHPYGKDRADFIEKYRQDRHRDHSEVKN